MYDRRLLQYRNVILNQKSRTLDQFQQASVYAMRSTSTGTGVSEVDEIANKIEFMALTYLPKLGKLLDKIQEKLDQGDESDYLLQCKTAVTRVLTKLRIRQAEYSKYNMKKLLALEKKSLDFIDSVKLSAALTEKLQVTDINQGQLSVNPSFMLRPPTPITGSQSAPWAVHRMGNSSVENVVHANNGYHPNQKTDPPTKNAQDGLDTSSHAAASSIVEVATNTQDYSDDASYLTSSDLYGYLQPANQPHTPQVGGSQNSGSPYQPLTSFQNSGSVNSSVDNVIHVNTGNHPNQKTDPPSRNAQDGLNTSSHAAASSIMGVATFTQDYSDYASYLASDDLYGYQQQASQPHTSQVEGSQNSGSPFQNSGSVNSSVDSVIYANTGYHPNQKTDPPPINAQDGLNTSSLAAASSILGVATNTQDYSYLTSNDLYGYQQHTPQVGGSQNSGSPYQHSGSYQNTCDYQTSAVLSSSDYGSRTKQANLWNGGSRPYTSHVEGVPISGSPYQPLTSFQNSGSYAGSASYPRSDHGSQTTQASLWNDASYENYPSHQYSGSKPADSRSAQSSSTVAHTADYNSQTSSDVTCAPGTENKSTSSAPTHDSETTNCHILDHHLAPSLTPLIPGVLGRYPISHTQPPPGTSWQPQVSSSGSTSWVPDPSSSDLASWWPEAISSGTTSWQQEPTTWKPEPTTPFNTTSWRLEPPSSSTTSWKPEPTRSSTTSWGPEPTATITMPWRPELTSSGLLTAQGSQVTGDADDGYWRQGPAAFQNHPVTAVTHTPSHFQRPLASFPVPDEVSRGIDQTACSQRPVSQFPATHGALPYASVLQSGSSMDTRLTNTLQTATNPSILHFSDGDQVERESLSKPRHKRRKI